MTMTVRNYKLNWICFVISNIWLKNTWFQKLLPWWLGFHDLIWRAHFFNRVAMAHQLDMIVCRLLPWPKIDWKNHAVRWDLCLLWFVCFWWMLLLCGGWAMSCFQEGRYAGGWWIYQQTWVDWISNSQWWNCLWLLLSTKQCRLFGRRRCTSFVGQGTWWSNFTDKHCIQCCTAVLDKPRFCCVSRWKKWKLSLVFGSGVEKYVHHPVWGCFVRLYMIRSIFPKLLLGY